MSLRATAPARSPSAEAYGPGGAVHQATLERAFGRTFAVVATLIVLQFWFSATAMSGQQPGSLAADLLLSLLVGWQAIWVLGRAPSQRNLGILAAATGVLMLSSRILATPGSPFLAQAVYVLAVPAAAAWVVWSRRLVVPVPLLLLVLATGAWHPGGDLAVEQSVAALATVTLAGIAARLMRAGARHADADADRLSRQIANQDAALAAEETERRAANAVHDDVLSVLRAVAAEGQSLPWSMLAFKARQAESVLARQVPADTPGPAALEPELRHQAMKCAPELDTRCRIANDLEVPPGVAEALSGATGEALRNVVAHAGVRSATLTARGDGFGGVEVTVCDRGAGFDPAQVGPTSTGLRNSIRGRLRDAGGGAEVIASPGQGTTVILTWRPESQARAEAVDPLALARRLAPRPRLIFLGFMLPVLLSSLVMLCLRWQDMRWQPAAATAYLGLFGLAVVCARCLTWVQMTRQLAASLTAAVTALAAMGSLAVAPGTTDAFSYWVAGDTGIVIAAVYFVRGPAFGLTSLALDLAALMTGILATGSAIPVGARLAILGSPTLGAGLAAGFRAALRGLSNHTEAQLADYRQRLRQQARADALSRVDSAALEYARCVAGPVLNLVASGQAPNPALQNAAALANATLRDELLAPGFLTAALAERVGAARAAGAHVTVDIAPQGDVDLLETARQLLAASIIDPDAAGDVTLQMHSPVLEHSALLIMHARSRRSNHAVLRERAGEFGALVSDLGDHELLVRLQPGPVEVAVPPLKGDTAGLR